MRIFVYKTPVEYYIQHPDSKPALEDRYNKIKESERHNFAEMKRTFNAVDAIGNKRFIFNIKGNSYLLVAVVLFIPKYVYGFIGTHTEYDKIDCSAI
ncbi:MAG: type II toxin-antitoxin system HigB family toxin [Prevotellaceae bacterium]|jgi:mRNA interferase HigB|nr:type II toxin-antitoxin system HigB family toxin [Prevotellaceae bacterium]